MSEKDFSGPAFPSESSQYGPVLGMSLRDYFAAKAMQSLLITDRFGSDEQDWLAKAAFEYADKMLAERAK